VPFILNLRIARLPAFVNPLTLQRDRSQMRAEQETPAGAEGGASARNSP